jgi:hypothetical protein
MVPPRRSFPPPRFIVRVE